jgi:uncharacterized protein involved in exopolysaccharide biosynthesis
MDEFIPLEKFYRILKLWWVVAITVFVGGALGYIYHASHPPVYEATATFFVGIDMDKMALVPPRQDQIQYNEDMALAAVAGVLRVPEVQEAVIQQSAAQGVQLDAGRLYRNHILERKHAFWELRFRDTDPALAQKVVNLWAEIGYRTMVEWQASGKIVNFVIIYPPTPAVLPLKPAIFDRNRLMAAGGMAGFVIGIVLTSLMGKGFPRHQPA